MIKGKKNLSDARKFTWQQHILHNFSKTCYWLRICNKCTGDKYAISQGLKVLWKGVISQVETIVLSFYVG